MGPLINLSWLSVGQPSSSHLAPSRDQPPEMKETTHCQPSLTTSGGKSEGPPPCSASDVGPHRRLRGLCL